MSTWLQVKVVAKGLRGKITTRALHSLTVLKVFFFALTVAFLHIFARFVNGKPSGFIQRTDGEKDAALSVSPVKCA